MRDAAFSFPQRYATASLSLSVTHARPIGEDHELPRPCH